MNQTPEPTGFRFYSDKSPSPRERERVAGEVCFCICKAQRARGSRPEAARDSQRVQWGLGSAGVKEQKRGLTDCLTGTLGET